MPLKVKIKRIDPSLPLPQYHTSGSVAFDLYARIDCEIGPKQLGFIPSNLIIETPHGYMLLVASRSGTPKKFGLSIPHGIGIIDQDFSGPGDELLLQVYNFFDIPVKITKGQRICQALFIKIDKAVWHEVDEMEKKTRGGFGSTG